MEFKVYRHVPAHLFVDEAVYFVSCRTFHGAGILDTHDKKRIVQQTLLEVIREFHYDFHAWVILGNHYHVLFEVVNSKTIPLLFQKIHGRSSFELNRMDAVRGRRVWYNYWDECVRDERDYYNKLNYIHLNPVKHGYVENAEDYEFSSYRAYLETNGEGRMKEILARYPVEHLLKNNPWRIELLPDPSMSRTRG